MMKRDSDTSIRLAFAACLTLAVAWPGAASAQSAADKETARAQFEQGRQRRDRSDFAGALEAFKAADAIMKVPTTKLAVARAYASLGQLVEARDAALFVELIPAASKEPQPFVDARAAAQELANDLVQRIPSLNIVIVAPPGQEPSQVSIDGEALPAAAMKVPRRVNPGKHVVVAAFAAGELKKEVDLVERQTTSLTFDVAELAKNAPATVPPPVAPAAEPQTSGSRSPLVWTGLGLAVVGVGVGVTGGLITLSKKSDVDAGCRDGKCPPAAYDALDGARTWATVSTIGFAAGGAGLVLAGIGLALGRSAPTQTGRGPSVTPTISAGGAGIAGTF